MQVPRYLFIRLLLLWNITARINSFAEYDQQDPVELSFRRSVSWDGFPSESITFEAFGRRFDTDLSHVDRRRLEDFPVFVGLGGQFQEEYIEDDDPLDVYQNDNALLAVRRRRDQGSRDWQVEVDGWIRDGDDEVFIKSEPWMVGTSRDPPHIIRRDGRGGLESDFLYVTRSTDEYLRSRRNDDNISVVVDLLVLIDNAIYREAVEQYGGHREAMKAIRKYYKVLMSLVDMRYQEIEDPALDIRVRIAKLFVAKDRASSPWSDNNIRRAEDDPEEMVLHPTSGLQALRDWLMAENDNSLRNIKYDHAMGFTGYTLMSPSGKITTGMAYVATICKVDTGYSCSILTERGGFVNAGTAVHELAHSLGAKHDGNGDNGVCPASDNYIMAPFNTGNPAVLANYFRFSACSLRGFKDTLSTEQAACLADSRSPGGAKGLLPGQQYSTEAQCRDVFGPDSGDCKSTGIQDPEDVCVRLWCAKPTNPNICITHAALSALYGTPCAKNKICRQGRCIYNGRKKQKTKPHTPEWNNNVETPSKTKTPNQLPCHWDKHRTYCYDLIASGPEYCERPDIREYCCFSCHYATLSSSAI